MREIIKTKYSDEEISKAADFGHTADSPVEILQALFDAAFYDVVGSFVLSGLAVSQLSTPSMNVQIGPGLAFDRASAKFLHLAAALSTAVAAADASFARYDTVEMQYLETDFDAESRAFKDPSSGTVSYSSVNTKTKVGVQIKCLTGTPGAGVAPAVESGWVKLGEVLVGAGATAIFDADVLGITAIQDGEANASWTAEDQVTFSLESVSTIKKRYLAHMVELITEAASVHGIRQGVGGGFNADMLDGHHGDYYRDAAAFDGRASADFATAAQGAKADAALPASSYTANDIMEKIAQTVGGWSNRILAGAETYVIPTGIYMMITNNVAVKLELLNSSSIWDRSAEAVSGMIISDGVNFRFINTGLENYVVSYRKLA